jgi:hypothetical protein
LVFPGACTETRGLAVNSLRVDRPNVLPIDLQVSTIGFEGMTEIRIGETRRSQ